MENEEKKKEREMSNMDLVRKIEMCTDILDHYSPELYWWRMALDSPWYEKHHNSTIVNIKPAFGIDIDLPGYMNSIGKICDSACDAIEKDVKTLRDVVEKQDFSNGDMIMDTYEKTCDKGILSVAKHRNKMDLLDRFYPNPKKASTTEESTETK